MFELILTKNDITTLNVDAIVNAANKSLLGGGGVDGAIHKAAGPKLLEACKKIGGAKTGEVKATQAFSLDAKYIFHAVGPIWQGGSQNEHELLRNCYLYSLKLCEKYHLKSIAFPAISCGVYCFPLTQACELVSRVLVNYSKQPKSLSKIILCCFDLKTFTAYEDALKKNALNYKHA